MFEQYRERRAIRRAYKEARALAAAGAYREALEKHQLYDAKIVQVRPAQIGIRDSYALASWAALGEQYPPAREALCSLRDEAMGRLEAGAGDGALFHRFCAMNRYLGEPERSVQLFHALDQAYPELAVAAYPAVEAALIAGRAFALAEKYLGDPDARFEAAVREHKALRWFAYMPIFGKRVKAAAAGLFEAEVCAMIAILRETGREAKAAEIRGKALAVLNSPAIRACC